MMVKVSSILTEPQLDRRTPSILGSPTSNIFILYTQAKKQFLTIRQSGSEISNGKREKLGVKGFVPEGFILLITLP